MPSPKETRRPGPRLVLALGAALLLGWWLGRPSTPPAHEHAHSAEAAEDTPAQEWTCSMHPQISRPGPGLCPICHMDLIPKNTGAGGDLPPNELKLSPEALRRAGLRTAPVVRERAHQHLKLIGEVVWDETRLADISARLPGRIERMFVDFEGMRLRKGDHLYQIYSPDLVTAQGELQQARRAVDRLSGSNPGLKESAERTLAAVRAKLRRWGLSNRQISTLEKERGITDQITLFAPQGGVVIERAHVEGTWVETGTQLYRIGELDHVWVEAIAYERHLPWIAFGQQAQFSVEALPGKVFTGTVAFIAPALDARSRAAKVRLAVPNPDGLLKPGMTARVEIHSELGEGGHTMVPELLDQYVCPMHPHITATEAGRCSVCGMALVRAQDLGYAVPDPEAELPLIVPSSAVLLTGERSLVYVAHELGTESPRFEARPIVLGPRTDDGWVVREGLQEGEHVVAVGAFLLDAELQIRGGHSMMQPVEAHHDHAEHAGHDHADHAGHDHADHAGHDHAAQTGPDHAALMAIVRPYVDFQKHLAADAEGPAAAAWQQLKQAIEEARFEGPLAEHTRALKDALRGRPDQIEAYRQSLQRVTRALKAAIQTQPGLLGQRLTIQFCPMAFNDTGAEWLQPYGEPLANPYFGASMLRCGSARGHLGPSEDAPKKPADAPKKPADTPKKPADAPKKPADAPKKPADASKKPADAPKKPADAPKKPADAPKKPADAPKKPADAPKKPAEAAAAAPKAATQTAALGAIVQNYLDFQKHLAADAEGPAAAAWQKLKQATDAASLTGPLAQHARPLKDALRGRPSNIEDYRRGLQRITRALKAAIQAQPGQVGQKLTIQFCPMAFENTGAEWFQPHGQPLANPYFGASMLRCGSARGSLGP